MQYKQKPPTKNSKGNKNMSQHSNCHMNGTKIGYLTKTAPNFLEAVVSFKLKTTLKYRKMQMQPTLS